LNRWLSALILLTLTACGGGDSGTAPTGGGTLVIEDLVVGTGATAVAGDTLTVHYVGTLTNGTKFDSSYDRGTPFVFRLGAGQVIAGWDQGVPGMKVGGKRRLTIPPDLAYGSRGQGVIPPNATLLFDVELVSIAGK
jgi:FKBP-type peptidyl-prolyl cis-trans isomerase FkpA